MPVFVPSTMTVAPMIGSPDTSATVPLTLMFWAEAADAAAVSARNIPKAFEKRF